MTFDNAFTMSSAAIKFGAGTRREVGLDMQKLGAKRVLVVADPNLSGTAPIKDVLEALQAAGIEATLFDDIHIEPTEHSFQMAIDFATAGNFDGYVAIGGGSTLDTAKVANLYASYPADFLDYVNRPIGKGTPVPGAVKPLIGIPTTAGTGSEATGVAIFDYTAMKVKTGISHPYLRPVLGIIDPDLTRTLPPLVAACAGLDVLCHAVESLTAIPYNRRPAPSSPGVRPGYQGSNPISDVWSSKAIQMVSQNLLRVMQHPEDDNARAQMLLAATFAGIGFGNAGVHLAHAMSYPLAGMIQDFHPEGYTTDKALLPHGMSVILNAPAVFRFTAPTNPTAHLHAAALMGVDVTSVSEADAGEVLAQAFIDIMQKTGMPNGISALGYGEQDIPALAKGAFAQQRLTALSPRPTSLADFEDLFRQTLRLW